MEEQVRKERDEIELLLIKKTFFVVVYLSNSLPQQKQKVEQGQIFLLGAREAEEMKKGKHTRIFFCINSKKAA